MGVEIVYSLKLTAVSVRVLTAALTAAPYLAPLAARILPSVGRACL